jgi:ssDNA-binding Zn-finger/Zn-ribbon topoisomerase 1
MIIDEYHVADVKCPRCGKTLHLIHCESGEHRVEGEEPNTSEILFN